MALITRLSRLFQADMNAVLDKIEEPTLLLKQSIREMEEAIQQQERQLRLWEVEQQQLLGKHKQLEDSLAELNEKLVLCFKSDKDDLARSLLKRKLETQQTIQLLTNNLAKLKENVTRLAKQLIEQNAQLANMKQKAEVLTDGNGTNVSIVENHLATVRDEDVEIAFLSEKQKWSQL